MLALGIIGTALLTLSLIIAAWMLGFEAGYRDAERELAESHVAPLSERRSPRTKADE